MDVTVIASWSELSSGLRAVGVRRGELVAVSIAPGAGVGIAVNGNRWAVPTSDPGGIVAAVEADWRPRWVWWSQETPAQLIAGGVRVATCWDISAVHRLLFGGWRSDPALAWARLRQLRPESMPTVGQLDLLDAGGDEGTDPEDPVRPDGHLRPEWVTGGWIRTPRRWARWSAIALTAAVEQERQVAALRVGGDPGATTRSESAAELLCAELAADGMPLDRNRAEDLLNSLIGPRPRDDAELARVRRRRDSAVLDLVPDGDRLDLRNPAQVRVLLNDAGIDVPDTRSWRLEPLVGTHPVVEALLTWRKAERIATTYGYRWLDQHVGPDDRLRGQWSGSDGAAGRMTASAGLHNLPAELRSTVRAEPGHVLVRADLGQIEPRVLAAVSSDPALIRASADDDLYAPVAARLGVARPLAKVAVLAAMYGQTSGAAGEALRGLEAAYPTAMRYLRGAYDAGRSGRDLRTYGGRLVRVGSPAPNADEAAFRAAVAAHGRFARNAVVQGAAAELFKAWAVTVRARIGPTDARIVLCLHDELLLHTPTERGDSVAQLLRDCLQGCSSRWFSGTEVRFVVDVSVVDDWSQAKA